MSRPKQHHFVPRMLAEAFTDGEGWLHWCDTSIASSVLHRARPEKLFTQGDLYTTRSHEGVIDNSVEVRFLGGVEHAAKPILQEIISSARKGRLPDLGRWERRDWMIFFLTQWRRTPEAQKSVIPDAEGFSILREILQGARQQVPHLEERVDELSSNGEMKRLLHNARTDTLARGSDQILSTLERRGIRIFTVSLPRKSLIIGSRPVVRFNAGERRHLSDPLVELWLPVAPDIAIGLGQGAAVDLVPATDERQVRKLNRALAGQSRFIAANSAALVRSISRPR
ncbi:DUF4238 domain-containing protein [Azorhizobium doebereinerae]|uniref:DUF4238 domain-containing protein n=1 Tax=Azorhizobium doebereinerae TaxID=281091 RepID=UPI000A03DAF0|nr:DUF4238 domain-containing protein [Azorhizobium doebereinerae]